jgi:hypothetical protein
VTPCRLETWRRRYSETLVYTYETTRRQNQEQQRRICRGFSLVLYGRCIIFKLSNNKRANKQQDLRTRQSHRHRKSQRCVLQREICREERKWRLMVQRKIILKCILYKWEPASSVSFWQRDGRPGDRDSITARGERISPLASVSRPALGPTQPPVQWVTGVISPGLKRVWGVTLTAHPILCHQEWVGAISLLPQAPPWRVVGQF